jgi:Flp pilus assembly pilin Flp
VIVRLSTMAAGTLAAARDRLFALRRDEGQAFVEYALVLLLIAVAIAAASIWTPLLTDIGKAVNSIGNALNGAPAA